MIFMKNFTFQAHVTTEKLTDTTKFINLCKQQNVKPVIIMLEQGDFCEQPMYTYNFNAKNLDVALKKSKVIEDIFEQNGFKIIRVKLEINAEDLSKFYNIKLNPHRAGFYSEKFLGVDKNSYFECHIKVKYESDEILNSLALQYGFYVSRNQIEPNIKYISLRISAEKFLGINFCFNIRNYLDELSPDFFHSRVLNRNLLHNFEKYNIEIVKEKYEWCVHDSKFDMDKNWGINMQDLLLEVKEDLIIYIVNNLPFVAKGSFLTKQYHENPIKRLGNGGDIDLICCKDIKLNKPEIIDYDSCHDYLREIEKLLQPEITAILYKAEELLQKKLHLLEPSNFIKILNEPDGYSRIFKDELNFYLVNYALDGDFTTVGLCIDDFGYEIEIDIAVDMPISFEPERILYKKLDGSEEYFEKTTPLLYQMAWKMHQMICRPRIKDMDDIMRFIPSVDLNNEENFKLFFDEIINECKLSSEENYKKLLKNMVDLFSVDTHTYCKKMDLVFENTNYYYEIYDVKDKECLYKEICKQFYDIIHNYIDCERVVSYIEKHL